MLTRVDLVVKSDTGSGYSASIHSESSGTPGASLGTLTSPATLSTTPALAQFTASGNGIALDPSTTYFVKTTGMGALHHLTASDAEDAGGSTGWSIANEGSHGFGFSVQMDIYGYEESPPAFSSAVVNGRILQVGFNEDLDTGSRPAGAAFVVSATPSGGTARTINGTGTAGIAGKLVAVNLASAVRHGETVTVSYTKPTTNPLQDAAGNDVATFTGQSATNNTPADTTPPTLSILAEDRTTLKGKTLRLTFDEDLDVN